MSDQPAFLQEAHRYFSAHCFNQAWDLIHLSVRTPEQDEQMIRLNQASTYHWTQRTDCTSRNLSIGYWQAARIHALLGRPDDARRYGRLALDHAQGESPFYIAYAYEALARAEAVAGHRDQAMEYLEQARRLEAEVTDSEDRQGLAGDLDALARLIRGG